MGKDESEKPLVRFPLAIDLKNARTIERKVLEINPKKIKVGEVAVVQVPQWGGLTNQFFAVMNVDGKTILVEQLTSRKRKKRMLKSRKK